MGEPEAGVDTPGLVRTERLKLVPVGLDHVGDLVLLQKGPDVAFWTSTLTWTQAEEYAAQMQARWRHDGVGKWMAYRLADNDLVGRGGMTWTEIDGRRLLELGWAVREQHRGEGFATEIGRAGLSFAFHHLGATEVVAFTEVHNRASRAVMARLGMTYIGQISRPGLIEGEDAMHDEAPFALYRIGQTTSPSEAEVVQPGS